MFAEFMNNWGLELIGTAILAIAGYLGLVVKGLISDYLKDKKIAKIVRVAVRGTEQMWKELHGEEKLMKALEATADMLAEKGLSVTNFELRMLIEDAVGEFNNAFNKTSDTTNTNVE
jgi:hypothetical protein